MKDGLEDFVRRNSAQFEDEAPSDKLWEGISNELDRQIKPEKQNKLRIWQVAAAVLLLACCWLTYDKVARSRSTEVAAVEALPSEVREVEDFYIHQIKEKREEVFSLTKNKPELKLQFEHELNELDSAYESLRQDFTNGDPEELTNAMIWNLQLRIKILNRQLEILQEIRKEVHDEKVI